MKLLPNFESAHVGLDKLKDYCLNEYHPTGKQKALVFKSALGITSLNASLLKEEILKGLVNNECIEKEADAFGTRYTVTMNIRIFETVAVVITGWIIKQEENFARLTSCYIKSKR